MIPDSGTPIFSIVVPTFRRPKGLHNLLAGIRALRFPHESIETIIVDDSGVQTAAGAADPFRRFFTVRVIQTPHLGPAAARQAGIDIARGEYFAFTDDDCVPDPDWLTELLKGLEEHPGCAIGGVVMNGFPENVYSSVSQMIFDYVTAWPSAGEPAFIGTCNVAFPAATFREVGGFDRNWELCGGEDREFCRRWRESGRQLVIRRSASVVHYRPMTLGQFLDQQYRYGRGASRFLKKGKAQPLRFYTGLIATGFRGTRPHPRILTGSLVMLSQAAVSSGFLAERLAGKEIP
jgi:GT2 family glycosyltransferase